MSAQELQVSQPAANIVAQRFMKLAGNRMTNFRSLTAVALLSTLVAAILVIILWTSSKNYVPLFGNQDNYDQAVIIDILDKESIPFKIDPSSGNLLVPQQNLANARITLGARGVKAEVPSGLSDWASQLKFGSSQFMESVQYQYALEGELSKSIMAIKGVKSARVHLARSEKKLFVGRNDPKTTASVVVDLEPGVSLSESQVHSIIGLVSGSVPQLSPEQVVLVDQQGNLLTNNVIGSEKDKKNTDKKLAYTNKIEQKIVEKIASMLGPVVGDDNYRIQVVANLDFNSVEETRETFDNEGVVKRENSKDTVVENGLAKGVPSVLARKSGTESSANASVVEKNNENQRLYDNGRVVTHTQYEIGRIQSLSVSVSLNSAVNLGNWSDDTRAEVANMIRMAAGFDENRNDQFSLVVLPFIAKTLPEVSNEPTPLWQQEIVQWYSKHLVSLLLGLCLIVFGVRPLVKALIGNKNKSVPPDDAKNDVQLLDSEPMAPALAETIKESKSTGQTPLESMVDDEKSVDLPPVGSDIKVQIDHLQLLVAKERDKVSSVIQRMLIEQPS